jgi:hypothetical protein
LVVAELHEQRCFIKLLDDGTDLSVSKPLRGRSVSNATTSKTDGFSFLAFFAFIAAPSR